MKIWIIGGAAVVMACLSGCQRATDSSEAGSEGGWRLFGPRHGRFVGLGIYNPGTPWTKMVDAERAKETPAARPIDDQAIFVVIDSATGELRACGDLSGYCIGMNPWKKPLTASQIAPITLTEHVQPALDVTEAHATIHLKTKEPKPVTTVNAGKPSPAPANATVP